MWNSGNGWHKFPAMNMKVNLEQMIFKSLLFQSDARLMLKKVLRDLFTSKLCCLNVAKTRLKHKTQL